MSPTRQNENETKNAKAAGPDETPEQKFKRLATARVNNAIKKIKLIGNLSAPAYKYTDEEVAKIIHGLKFTVEEVEAKFAKGKKKESGFQL